MEKNKLNKILTNVDVIVSSTTVEIASIIEAINQCKSEKVIYLTTNKLFVNERNVIKSSVPNRNIEFNDFTDFLTDRIMQECDCLAFKKEKVKQLRYKDRMSKYYSLSLELKNQKVAESIQNRYQIKTKLLIATDLGITKSVWMKFGYLYKNTKAKRNFPYVKIRNIKKRLIELWKEVDVLGLCQVIEINNEKTLFFGSLTRIIHRFSKKVRIIKTISFFERIKQIMRIFFFVFKYCTAKNSLNRDLVSESYIEKEINRLICFYRSTELATTFHEYCSISFYIKSVLAKKGFVVLQDGFLPENYSSKYFKYYLGVKEFLVWDRLSLGIFKKNRLKAKVSNIFKKIVLPEIKIPRKIKKILIATSSAGDWTALKNRSDDDKLAIFFMNMSNHFSKINFLYRAHPFMSMPSLHGVKALVRLENYFSYCGRFNIKISLETKKQSKNSVLYIPPISFNKDLENADVVFGEHSIAMIDSAISGKVWASVNVTKRRDLFESYTKLGFYNIKSTSEGIKFLNDLISNPDKIEKRYNEAVLKYNSKYN